METAVAFARVAGIFLLALIIDLSGAQAVTEVNIGDSSPPFMYADQNGHGAGIYAVIIKEIFKRIDEPLNLQAVPWRRCLAATDEGKAATGGIYKNSERLEKYDFSAALYTEEIVVFVKQSSALKAASLEDLKGKMLGIQSGWSLGDAFDTARKNKLFLVDESKGSSVAFKKLRASRIDAYVNIREDTLYNMKMENITDIRALDFTVSKNETFLAFGKNAQSTELIKRIDVAIVAMQKDGTIKEIVTKFLSH